MFCRTTGGGESCGELFADFKRRNLDYHSRDHSYALQRQCFSYHTTFTIDSQPPGSSTTEFNKVSRDTASVL
jgi:hypothetical protein